MPPSNKSIRAYDTTLIYQGPGQKESVEVGQVKEITPPVLTGEPVNVDHLARRELVRQWKERGEVAVELRWLPATVPVRSRLRELPNQGDGVVRFEVLDIQTADGQVPTMHMHPACPREAVEAARRLAREGRYADIDLPRMLSPVQERQEPPL